MPLSPRERGWGEGSGRSHRNVRLHEASPEPSSAPTGHLLPKGEGKTSSRLRQAQRADQAADVDDQRDAAVAQDRGAGNAGDAPVVVLDVLDHDLLLRSE